MDKQMDWRCRWQLSANAIEVLSSFGPDHSSEWLTSTRAVPVSSDQYVKCFWLLLRQASNAGPLNGPTPGLPAAFRRVSLPSAG